MSNKQRIADYDRLAQKCSTLELALHDLVNGAFGPAVRVSPKEVRADWTGGHYSVRLSPRGEPLFLVAYVCRGQSRQVEVWTHREVDARLAAAPDSVYFRTVALGIARSMERARTEASS